MYKTAHTDNRHKNIIQHGKLTIPPLRSYSIWPLPIPVPPQTPMTVITPYLHRRRTARRRAPWLRTIRLMRAITPHLWTARKPRAVHLRYRPPVRRIWHVRTFHSRRRICRLGDILGRQWSSGFAWATPSCAEVDGAKEEGEAGCAADGYSRYGARA